MNAPDSQGDEPRPPSRPPPPGGPVDPRFRRHPVANRILFFGSTTILSAAGCIFMADFLWRIGFNGPRLVLLVLFCLLFTLICLGFNHALFGFVVSLGRAKRAPDSGRDPEPGASPATAIVFVVYNENVTRVFAGLRTIYRSLEREDKLAGFEFFVLSDSRNPDRWVEEEMAWVRLCREVRGFGRIFYRRRRENTNKKSGNIADFCRTWGGRYTYMFVCDADSVMAGKDIVRMVNLMEAHPTIGILQTAPRLFGGESLFGRMQQFANALYGRMYCVGLDFWQCGVGNYWGHNAAIRLEPFIDYCDLPDLPGREPFGGKILSHDFVEAALMRRAGWEVWLLHELDGSWEESPQSLIDAAKRDRRWCQGNLQHTWLLFSKGLHPANKIHLFMGIMGYWASPLWLVFLALSTWATINHLWSGLSTIPPADGFFGELLHLSLFLHGLLVFALTLALLLVPKCFAWLLLAIEPARAHLFGGRLRAAVGILIELLLSTLIAPMLMLFHTHFILDMFFGRSVEWKTQRRGAGGGVSWRESLAAHWAQTALAVAWGALAWRISHTLFWWLSPVLIGLLVAIPVSVLTSRTGPGAWLRRHRLLLTPEESQPALELADLAQALASAQPDLAPVTGTHDGITAAVVDPYVNGVHVSLQEGSREDEPEIAEIGERLVREGPDALAGAEVLRTLHNPTTMVALHRRIWASPFREIAPWWQKALDAYRRPPAKFG